MHIGNGPESETLPPNWEFCRPIYSCSINPFINESGCWMEYNHRISAEITRYHGNPRCFENRRIGRYLV